MPIILKRKRTPEEFAAFATEMAQLNLNGFRNPGKCGTSLPEKAAEAAGLMRPEWRLPLRKRTAARRAFYLFELERLIGLCLKKLAEDAHG